MNANNYICSVFHFYFLDMACGGKNKLSKGGKVADSEKPKMKKGGKVGKKKC